MFEKLYRSKLFPLSFQLIALVVFILLVIGGLGISTDSSAILKQLRNTNLSNLIVWSYWWPLIVAAAVLFGRQWCTVCPIELLSAISVKLGFKKRVPRFLKSGWMITILYAFVAVIAIHTWGIHRTPHLMAWYLLSLMGLAVLVSLIFEKRAFCSYFCPVGKLLGLYSLLSKFGLRVKSKDVCKDCVKKDCVHKDNQNKLIGRSCTSGIYPANISDNRDCILCTQCVKACPNDNISLQGNQKSYSFFDINKLGSAEVGMVTILIGFIIYEVLSSWRFTKSILMTPSNFIYNYLPEGLISAKAFEGIILFLIFPLLFLLLFSGLSKLTGKHPLSFYLKRTAGFLLPLVALGHVFKALMKTTSRIPYWKYALDKPDGVEFAEAIVNKQAAVVPLEWLTLSIVFAGMGILAAALYFSFRKIYSDNELSSANKKIYYFVVLIYFSLLMFGPISNLVIA